MKYLENKKMVIKWLLTYSCKQKVNQDMLMCLKTVQETLMLKYNTRFSKFACFTLRFYHEKLYFFQTNPSWVTIYITCIEHALITIFEFLFRRNWMIQIAVFYLLLIPQISEPKIVSIQIS